MDSILMAKKLVADVERMVTGTQCGDIESRETLITFRNRMERDGLKKSHGWGSIYDLIDQTIRDTADNPLA